MPVISDTLLRVTLPSGNAAVYLVQPQHLPRDDIPESRDWPRMHGEQIAHQCNGVWYEAAGPMKHAWHEITDTRTLALIERTPEA